MNDPTFDINRLNLVIAVLAELVPDHQVSANDKLRELPHWNSIFFARLIEAIEDRTGSELPPDVLLPEVFSTPTTIAEMLTTIESQSKPRSEEKNIK